MLRIATYLDPRFKSLSFLNEVENLQVKLDVKQALVELIRKEDGAETEDNADSTSSSTVALPSGSQARKKQKLELLLEDIFDNTDSAVSIPLENAERELHTYESEVSISLQERNPLTWWKACACTYKYLTKLVKRTLSVAATSVPSERLFSYASNLISEKRSCLNPKYVSFLVGKFVAVSLLIIVGLPFHVYIS